MSFNPFSPRPPYFANPLDEIYPNLWLGSLQAAESAEILRAHSITDIISITSHRPSIPHGLNIRKKHFRLRDNTTADLLSILPECIERIEHVLAAGVDELGRERRVLVHCRMGISRSGGMVVAYAMKSAMMPAAMALEYVRSRRPIVNPNRAFMAQLTVWGECGYDTALLMPDMDMPVKGADEAEKEEEEEDEELMLQRALEMSLLHEGLDITTTIATTGGDGAGVLQEPRVTTPVAWGLTVVNSDTPIPEPAAAAAAAMPGGTVVGEEALEDGMEGVLSSEILDLEPRTPPPSLKPDAAATTAALDPTTIPLPLTPPDLHPEQRSRLKAWPEELWIEIRMRDTMRRCFEECVRDVGGGLGDASAR